MERLWSPWRSKYIATFSEKKENKKESCAMCEAYKANDDDERLIAWREQHCFVLMNLFPYNSGHLLIVPYKHTATISNLDENERKEIMQLICNLSEVLRSVMHAEGLNIGCNVGRIAGAGIESHIHFHIVPRWNGDTNFLPVFADTKVISEEMHGTMVKLRRAFGV
ncbi:MAG: HIT domain-containing protein [Ignavibacteria bacterium]|nr:HIT domain-containing protein [Ignavibacteria bacterium]